MWSDKALEQRASCVPENEDRRLSADTELDTTCPGERTEQPQTWRLLGEGVDGEPVEELVFTIAGILSEVDLPPVEEKPSVMPRKYRFLRQGVVITGLGSPTFEAAVDLTRDIYKVFQREFPRDVNGGNSFSRAKPQVFRVGDLVDVQVSFVVVELRQQKFKMVPVLRTIALVDGNFTQMARRKRQGSGATSANSVQTTLKRRVGYDTVTREQEKKGHTMQLDG
ncbi:hypothetical protein BD779DRAFT_1683918 [Infundibulicybe gibba]|nr:hypothetical protein BD779DRAFT_1683918 [Infundibulicybe gibba]